MAVTYADDCFYLYETIRAGIFTNQTTDVIPFLRYAGLKHSSCTAFINEQGGSVDELQMLTDHSRRDSVLRYADVKLGAKRNIMGKVIFIKTENNKASK